MARLRGALGRHLSDVRANLLALGRQEEERNAPDLSDLKIEPIDPDPWVTEPALPAQSLRLPDTERPLSQLEVATLFGVDRRTIRNWSAKGILHPRRIGGRVYFPRRELDELLDSGRL